MGVPPKVQPSFADIIHIANKKQDDTAPMCVPPKVQPTCADIIHTANKKLGYTAPMGVPPKVQPTFADIIRTANKKLGYTALMGVPPKVQPTFYFLLLLGSRDGAVFEHLSAMQASHQCGPGSIPRLGVKCGLSLLLILFLAP